LTTASAAQRKTQSVGFVKKALKENSSQESTPANLAVMF